MRLDILGDNFLQVNKSSGYETVSWQVSMNYPHADNLRWLETFRKEHEAEVKLRAENEAVKKAYEHYNTLIILAKKEQANVV